MIYYGGVQGGIKGTMILVVIQIIMLTAQSEIRPSLNNLSVDFDDIFKFSPAMIQGTNDYIIGVIWITILTLQIRKPDNVGELAAFTKEDLRCLGECKGVCSTEQTLWYKWLDFYSLFS